LEVVCSRALKTGTVHGDGFAAGNPPSAALAADVRAVAVGIEYGSL